MTGVEAEIVVLEKCFRQSVIIVATIAKCRLDQVVKNQSIAATASIKQVIEEASARAEMNIDLNAVSEIRVHDLIDQGMIDLALMQPVTIAVKIARFLLSQPMTNPSIATSVLKITKTQAEVRQVMPLKLAWKA